MMKMILKMSNIMLVGHNTVRSLVMGDSKSAPNDPQLQEMQRLVTRALEQGACGFSSGLSILQIPPLDLKQFEIIN